uniref:Uncharacterized protein n=1 Tax=Hemiselmis andersenii TaxID=464988 RepID=A0A6U2B612_HEMAN|mmetsp:Transcript_1400/g.3344  ORF Transcript_1400/g.3344 Transcript_1400/m.3344 type:complete len:1761 (-) Transcript_1400:138-5420(-)
MAPRRLDLLALSAQRHTLLAARALDAYSKNPSLHGKEGGNGILYKSFSSRPIDNVVAALRWFKGIFVVVMFPALLRSVADVVLSERLGKVDRFSHYRFTSLELRDGSAPKAPGIEGFGLLNHGERNEGGGSLWNYGAQKPCRTRLSAGGEFVEEGATLTLKLPAESGVKYDSPYDQWYIQTLLEPGSEGKDPVRFTLEGSDDQVTWTQVGSSGTTHFWRSVIFTDTLAEVPTARGFMVVLDASLPLGASPELIFESSFLASIILFLLTSFAMRRVKWCIILVLGFQAVLRFVVAFALFGMERHLGCIPHIVASGIVFAVGGLWTAFMEEVYELMMVFVGLTNVVVQVIRHRQVYGVRGFTLSEVNAIMPGGVVWAVLGAGLSILRAVLMRQAVLGIQSGKAVYDEVFARVVEEQGADLARLHVTVARIQRLSSAKEARQLVRDTTVPEQAPASDSNVLADVTVDSMEGGLQSPRGAWGYLAVNVLQSQRLHETMLRYSHQAADSVSIPVQTLDQLHAQVAPACHWSWVVLRLGSTQKHSVIGTQAFLVYDMFLDVVVRLGKDYNGLFRLQRPTESEQAFPFDSWNGGPLSRGRFELGGIKSVRSCCAKLDLAYGGDVTRLLDVCRETLYLKRLKDLDSCLKAIANDPELEIVRIKNTIPDAEGRGGDEEGPGFLSAGMKFVSVGVRLVGNEMARSLCVDTHVCELLLVLTDIGCVQTQEMRDAYKQWRKCKRVMAVLWRKVAWAKDRLSGVWCCSSNSPPSKRVSPATDGTHVLLPHGVALPDTILEESSGGEWGVADADHTLGSPPKTFQSSSVAPDGTVGEIGEENPNWTQSRPSPDRRLAAEGSLLNQTPSLASLEVAHRSGPWQSHEPQQTSPEHRSLGEVPKVLPLKQFFKQEMHADRSFDIASSTSQPGAEPHSSFASSAGELPGTASESLERGTGFDLAAPLAPQPLAVNGTSRLVGAVKAYPSLSRSSKSVVSSKSGASDVQVMEPIDERCGTPDSQDMQKVMAWLNGVAGEDRDYEWDGGETSWGLAVSGEMEELLEGLCRMSALGISDFLDRRFDDVRKDTDVSFNNTSSLGSVIYSTQPVNALLRRRPVQLFVLGLSAVFCRGLLISKFSYDRYVDGFAFGPFTHYRLETVLTRNGAYGHGISGPGLSDFGVLGLSKCSSQGDPLGPDDAYDAVVSTHGRSIVATYPEKVGMTGWYLSTGASEGSQDLDPAYFNVWATNDPLVIGNVSCGQGQDVSHWWEEADAQDTTWCGAKWSKVGASSWRYSTSEGRAGPGGPFWHFVQAPVGLPQERGPDGFQSFLLFPAWWEFDFNWVLPDIFGSIGFATSALAGFASGVLPRHIAAWLPMPHHLLGCCLIGSVCSTLLHSALLLAHGVSASAMVSFTASIPMAFVPFCVLMANAGNSKPLVLIILWCYAFLENARQACVSVAFFHSPFSEVSLPGIFGLTFVVLATLLRLKALWSSTRILRQTRLRYDALWKQLWNSEGGQESIQQLERIVKTMVVRDFNCPCRQYNRRRAGAPPSQMDVDADDAHNGGAPIHPLFRDLDLFTIPDAVDTSSRVKSCNQLFCQAAIANLLLIDRLKEWADVSQGLFWEASAEGGKRAFVKWSDVKGSVGAARRIHWSPMKRHERCIEKMVRSYDNDPSRLLDISRGSIAFESLGDLTECLEAIWADENVVVSRITNRMGADFKSDETGGYRDVSINLRLVSPEAQALGAELHVCEVQLLLKGYALLRSQDYLGYVRARDWRGS